jgi:hypothetical protein
MRFNVLSTSALAMLHDAIISQLLCIWASAADLLFWLCLRCRTGSAGSCAESDASVFTDVEFHISEMNGNNTRSGTGRPRVDYIHQ